jgi:tetratricopeptide (TPR) repeat protein
MVRFNEGRLAAPGRSVLAPKRMAYMKVADGKEYTNPADELTAEGYRFLNRNRLDEAEGRFKASLERDPGNALALSGLGDTARKKGDFTAGLGYFSKCLERHPGNDYARFGLGDCYRGLNDLRRAIETWRVCLDHDGKNLNAMSSIGDAYRKLSDFAHAQASYQDALKIDPRCRHALKGLGYLYYDMKMFHEGAAYWETVLRSDENLTGDTEILAAAGNCLRRAFEFTKALPYFERVVGKEPDGFPGNFGMADCCRGLGDFRGARQYYDKILEREPDNPSILTRAGDMCVNLDDFEQAWKYFDRALAGGDNMYARLGFAHIMKRTGRFREALRLLEDIDARHPGQQRIHNEIKECRDKMR